MARLEKEAMRFADSLDDYDHVAVADMGGQGQRHWLVVRDHRFEAVYQISCPA